MRECVIRFNSANHLIRHFYQPINIERLLMAVYGMERGDGRPLFATWRTAGAGISLRYVRSYQRTRSKFRNLISQLETWKRGHEREGSFPGLNETMYGFIMRELQRHLFFLNNFVLILPQFNQSKQEMISRLFARYVSFIKRYVQGFMERNAPGGFIRNHIRAED